MGHVFIIFGWNDLNAGHQRYCYLKKWLCLTLILKRSVLQSLEFSIIDLRRTGFWHEICAYSLDLIFKCNCTITLSFKYCLYQWFGFYILLLIFVWIGWILWSMVGLQGSLWQGLVTELKDRSFLADMVYAKFAVWLQEHIWFESGVHYLGMC